MTSRRLPPLLLALLLLAGTVIATLASLDHERARAAERGAARAERVAAVVRLSLTVATSSLEETAGRLEASGSITEGEFAVHGRRTLAKSGLNAVRWVERIPAADRARYERATGLPIVELVAAGLRPAGSRPVYYPVTYSVTDLDTATVAGLDLATDPARRDAMEAAVTSGGRAVTVPVGLPGIGDRGTVMFQPVFRGGVTPALVTTRERRLRGFVIGAFRLDALIVAAQAAVAPGLPIEIRDDGTLLSARAPAAANGPSASIPVAGRQWTIQVAASSPSRGLTLTLLIAGLGLTMAALALAVAAGRRDRFAREAVTNATEELHASRSSHRALVENSPDVVTRFDPGLRCLYANAAIERVTGRPADYFVGRNMDEAGGSDEMVETLASAVLTVFATGKATEADFEVLGPEGLAAMHARLAPEPAPDGRVESVLVVSRDVTAHWAAEAALRSSEARHRSLVAAMTDGVVLQATTGAIVACNPAAERILGLSADQLMGRESIDPRWRAVRDDGSAFPGEEHPAMVTLRTGRGQRDILMGVHQPDGTLVWISASSEPIENDGAVAVVTCFTDVTARRNAEREQAALRRIATMVAAEVAPGLVFAGVSEEAAQLVGAESAAVVRFDTPTQGTVLGAWARDGVVSTVGGQAIPLGPGTATGTVAATGRPARAGDERTTPGHAADVVPGSNLRSGVSAPIVVDGAVWGALSAGTTHAEPLPPGTEERLCHIAELAALAIVSASARDQMAVMATTDHLTGLWNRRTFHGSLDAEIERARRHDRPMALVMMDIDRFKRVNDVHGHPAGDRVLIEVASRLRATVREGEVVARIGGEEFAWILPETDAEGAMRAAERARAAIAATPFPGVGPLTVSLGACGLDAGETADELIRRADIALYRSKTDGRDRVTLFTPEPIAPARLPAG